MIIGFTLAKNAVAEEYPIDLCILQHTHLFDIHYIGVPRPDQDEDDTQGLVRQMAAVCEQSVVVIELDWPGDGAWTEESLDKKLQTKMLEIIQINHSLSDWIIKIDADEFYSENDFNQIRMYMDIAESTWGTESEICNLSTGYLQFFGSLMYTVKDPTEVVWHIFKNNRTVRFLGNDAMILMADGDSLNIDNCKLHHIGYVKPADKITKKIKEHLILNASVYNVRLSDDWEFKWPRHKKGAYQWPIGLGPILHKEENAIEYCYYDKDKLPFALRDRIAKFTFCWPLEGEAS